MARLVVGAIFAEDWPGNPPNFHARHSQHLLLKIERIYYGHTT